MLGGVFLLWMCSFSAHAQESAWGNCLTSDLWIVSDYSYSMSTYEKQIYEAATSIVDGIMSDNHRARVGMVTFNWTPVIVQTPTFDKDKILSEIQKRKKENANYGTMMHSAFSIVDKIQDEIEPSPFAKDAEFRKIIIMISDGEDGDKASTLEVIKKMKENKNWWIFSLFVHKNKVPENDAHESLSYLAKVSGFGKEDKTYVDVAQLQELPQYFQEQFTCF